MEQRHRDVLRKNRIELKRDLDSKQATSYLYAKEIISEGDKEDIEATTVAGERSEKLLDILPKRGPTAFPTFIEFLKGNQAHLFRLLNGATKSPVEDSTSPADNTDHPAPSSSDAKPAVISVEETADKHIGKQNDEESEDGKRKMSSSSDKQQDADEGDGNQSLFHNPPSRRGTGIETSDIYRMSNNPRGQAFIINNKTFKPSSGMQKYPRSGTDVDAEALKKLFQNLGFKTRVANNASSKETFQLFETYAKMDHSDYDCVMCAVLTHGEEGIFYSVDGTIKIKELTSKFRGKWMGKPKLFFFQACQGFEYMDGTGDMTDGALVPEDQVDAPGDNKITLPVEADFLYAYSTVPGYYSWRNSVRGSWFAQAIVSVFEKYGATMDVLRMMTRVNNEVARQKSNTNEFYSDNKKQIPSVISQLRKELYFFPENVVGTVNEDGNTAQPKKKGRDCSIA